MKQSQKIDNILTIREHLTELKHVLKHQGLTDKITPEGRILIDIESNVLDAYERVKYALTVAQSHN